MNTKRRDIAFAESIIRLSEYTLKLSISLIFITPLLILVNKEISTINMLDKYAIIILAIYGTLLLIGITVRKKGLTIISESDKEKTTYMKTIEIYNQKKSNLKRGNNVK